MPELYRRKTVQPLFDVVHVVGFLMMTQQDRDTGNVACATLDSCPQCDYILRGLPANQNCPECGLAYDENSAIWRRRFRWREAILPLIGTYWVANMSSYILIVMPDFLKLIFMASILTALIVQIARFWSLYRHGKFVAVMPLGLIFRLEKKEPVFIPWSNITHLSVKPSPLGAIISLKKEQTVKDILRIFPTRAEAELFVECAESQRARHCSAN